MKILVIGPLPAAEYTTGQAAAVQLLYDALRETDEVRLVNLSSKGGGSSNRFQRVGEAIKTAGCVWKNAWGVDLIYFTISESVLGNIRDFLIYVACFSRLRCVVVHLHGGHGMRNLLKDRDGVLSILNRFFLSKIRRAIVLGDSQRDIFAGYTPADRVSVVPNFAHQELFLSCRRTLQKYEKREGIKLLFLSNLIAGKGHMELLGAYMALDESYQKRLEIDFAGHLEVSEESRLFLLHIRKFPNVRYHGPVFGDQKKRLFHDSQIFCLPTYYAYEGQPISILEAYASGCVVITCYHSGIVDIFKDGINGFVVEARSVVSLRATLETVCDRYCELAEIGVRNNAIAVDKYTTQMHLECLTRSIKA